MAFPSFHLEGKVAVVTGGGSGLGREFVLALARAGADIALAGRTKAALESTCHEVSALGRRVLPLQADVARPEDIARLVGTAVSEFGKIDILVNNAGHGIRQMAEKVTEDEFDQTIRVNLRGTFFCGQMVAKQMISQRYGKIINVASVLGATALPGGSAYGASKAGIIHLTKSWAREWSRFGITVNAIAPSYSRTGMTAEVLDNDAYAAHILSRTPMARFPSIEELTGPFLFLCSDAANYITGQTLFVDGGWTVG